MQNLRIVSFNIVDSSNIEITFTHDLINNLSVSNANIIPDKTNIPIPEILSFSVNKKVISLVCQPLTQMEAYSLTFQSTIDHPFISLHAEAKLSEDEISNKIFFTGPLEPNNPVKDFLLSFYRDNLYKTDDQNSTIGKYINALSINLARALYDIRQVGNENYLSFTVVDEQKTRGSGPFDRLNEESTYEVVRVGLGSTNAALSKIQSLNEFPRFPITLQSQINSEIITPGSEDTVGTFNINTLTFNLSNAPVTKVTGITFTLSTTSPIFNYDISSLGYQLNNSRYDQDFASTYLLLSDNQVKLNEKVLDNPLFSLNQIINITINYESKNLGIVVDPNTVNVYTLLTSNRETVPPIINVFTLNHAPIVDGSGNIPTLRGIVFIDPNSNNNSPHPAFITEIPFRLESLPVSPGQYAIDYATGKVYVFGADFKNDGTGPFPPLATYTYKFTYKSEIDYVYDSDLSDIVALPKGSLINNNGNINFNFEKVLIPEIDYVANIHQEELSERIENRLVALNALLVKESPITDVFKIVNETSGEIYNLDRFNGNKVYFRFNTPPRINAILSERVLFKEINNELLFINSITLNSSSLRIFTIFLNNNDIISGTEDSIGSSFNSSLSFSDLNIFKIEKWFNPDFSEIDNIDRLLNAGEYIVDYTNGIVYCAVSNTQGQTIGTATYKTNSISPQFSHLISVEDIYYRISQLNPKDKNFSYSSFGEGFIIPNNLDPSSELFLNKNEGAPYEIFGGKIGVFSSTTFLPGVSNRIKFLRSIFEFQDLLHNNFPLNFAAFSNFQNFNINVASITNSISGAVQFDGTNFFVLLDKNITYLSPSITYNFSIVRSSDSSDLWSTPGILIPGEPLKLILSGVHSPMVGDLVQINYTFTINDLARVVVDYNKGDFFVDYTYLADEILISYEHGDNTLDFRKNKNLPANTQYFVTYKVGALREALLKNFGKLINIPELTNFDVDLNRERYRDAVMAALTSFIQGPTVTAISNIGQTISHVKPEIIESAFVNWSLGSSTLSPTDVKTTREIKLLPGKHDNGVVLDDDQTITLPSVANLRLEEGTFESWIQPNWNGIDNDAELQLTITKDGYAIDHLKIFLGANEVHPVSNIFTLKKSLEVSGIPNLNKDGVFIYYALDPSQKFSRWFINIIDGYVNPASTTYRINITSNGKFYDVKSLTLPKPTNLTLTTGNNNLKLVINENNSPINEGITFISDLDHYILDSGKADSNKLSILKDISGYINFRVIDKFKRQFIVSSDVSNWKANELHHVAASWKLNTRNDRDEMHLFIDGFEVPNIIKYGQNLFPFLHEKFRTIDPEEIIGLSARDIVGSVDLQTTAGNFTVISSINFSAFNIFPGDTIFIDELGFSSSGYTISMINGQSLTLSSAMPLTISNAKFSVNRTNFTITSEIDVAPNIAVSTIHSILDGNDLSTSIGSSIVNSISTNFSTLGILPGYLLRIENSSLQPSYVILQVSGNSLTINGTIPLNLTNATFHVYNGTENEIPGIRALRPSYSISKDSNFNNILTISNNVFKNDLILIRLLGLNNRKVKERHYLWGNSQNIIASRLPPPISLDEAKITKVILPNTIINSSNSTGISGVYTSNNIPTDQPVDNVIGRTINATISGTNVDFSTPVAVTINGVSNSITVSETINFTNFGTLNFTHLFTSINYVNVVVKPININRTFVSLELKEKFAITHQEGVAQPAIIRFSYPINSGFTITGNGSNIVTDSNNLFSLKDIGNYLFIQTPPVAAGFYQISSISADRKSLILTSNAPSFINGVYQVLNVSDFRSGLQNGLFTFEILNAPGQPYFLNKGFYDIEYSTYAQVKIDPTHQDIFFGSNLLGADQLNGILDEVKIYSLMLTDTRIGETIPDNQNSITKDFNSIKHIRSDSSTLVLLHFDNLPLTNQADFYVSSTFNKQLQSSVVINENFGNSLVLLDKPVIISNDGILDTKKEGTIEFWVNPIYDTGNDPNERFYFDAFGAIIEETVSINNTTIKLNNPIGTVLNVILKSGDPRIDYFAGGTVDFDNDKATVEEIFTTSLSSVKVSKQILQVLSVKIAGDLTETDYFANGVIGSDKMTIFFGKLLPIAETVIVTYKSLENGNKINSQVIRLNKKLPYQNSRVLVEYLPKGLQGDRISIKKDIFGNISFNINASGIENTVQAPTRWVKGTWHRIKASYKINQGLGIDEMRLFLDGYQYTNLPFGVFLAGDFPITVGESIPGNDGYAPLRNMIFKDPINTLFIGSQYNKSEPAFVLMDNFRISNLSRPIFAPFGEPQDVNFGSNINTVFPVTKDLYTTLLLDFDAVTSLDEDFTVLRNRKTGRFDFSVNIFDSLDIVSSSTRVQEILLKLLNILKPANSRIFVDIIGTS